MRLSPRLLVVVVALCGLATSAPAQTAPETVRVRLLDRQAPSRVTVEADGPLYVSVDGADRGAALGGTPLTLSARGAEARAEFGGADLSAGEIRLTGERLRVRAAGVDRVYAGALVAFVEGGRLRLVNHTPTEPYVASVVASEFGFNALEGAKAQAVLARTYAARRAGQHARHDLDDHTGSQVFHGIDAATDVARRAAHETAGEVLAYRGQLADAFYFSSSGGHTADNDAVWSGQPLPYLRGVPDPYDQGAPDHTWQTTASRSAVLRALSSEVGGSVTGLEVTRRSRSGRVLEIRAIGGRRGTLTGPQFRRAVNAVAGGRTVRSTRFEVSVSGDRYVFTGSGFGHGVGLSQYGALGQSQQGRTYRQILGHYFQGTEVSGTAPFAAPLLVATAADAPARTQPTPRHRADRVAEPGDAAQAIPREPSSLRTRYLPASGRRWPTPRRETRESADPPADVRERVELPARPAAPVVAARRDADTPDESTPRRRTAW
ncbi:SpoIID/LytB domain-containing protein [Rubrivirga sp. IMCC45206]|uniref:SpoIID/LytB domain-containing protein n=1 Tax=Rubrivirga sp. IMCC45206 TaxID=3391614 RepID=UPI00398F8ED4